MYINKCENWKNTEDGKCISITDIALHTQEVISEMGIVQNAVQMQTRMNQQLPKMTKSIGVRVTNRK